MVAAIGAACANGSAFADLTGSWWTSGGELRRFVLQDNLHRVAVLDNYACRRWRW